MRIITGAARGRKLKEPADQAVRPTSSMVKEAIFSIVQFDIEGRHVLDLFAGTGQMGLEALSRGAKSCDFVDHTKAHVQLVKENIKSTELTGGQVFLSDAGSFLKRKTRYDLIFLDPPYDFSKLDQIIQDIVGFDILNKNGIIVCETKLEQGMPDVAAPYEKVREYRYGKVKVTVYTRT